MIGDFWIKSPIFNPPIIFLHTSPCRHMYAPPIFNLPIESVFALFSQNLLLPIICLIQCRHTVILLLADEILPIL